MKNLRLVITIFLISLTFFSPVLIKAQDVFSGNNPESYQCFDSDGQLLDQTPTKDPTTGGYVCEVDGVTIPAVVKPPSLQSLQALFIKILYAIWALVGGFSFLMVIVFGYQWLISRGDPTKITAIRDRLIKFIMGFALVFLAYPILVTVFQLLNINTAVTCYRGLTGYNDVGLGFQFFFNDLCTDPKGEKCEELSPQISSVTAINSITGVPCSSEGKTQTCSTNTARYSFRCVGNYWQYTGGTQILPFSVD